MATMSNVGASVNRNQGTFRQTPEAGVGVIEFALVLPIFLLLILGALELAHAIQVHQAATMLSRTAAKYAIHNWVESPTPIEVDQNLRDDQVKVGLFGNEEYPGTEIMVSVYVKEGGTIVRKSLAQNSVPTCTNPGYPPGTRYDVSGGRLRYLGQPDPETEALLEELEDFVVIGEACVPYNPLVAFIGAFFASNLEVVYDSTIM